MLEGIHPQFDKQMTAEEKEDLTCQHGIVVWLYGLSGSGKSTIAQELERKLTWSDYVTSILDGDNLRAGINEDLDFSEEGRTEHIRRTAEIAKLMRHSGVTTIATIITPLKKQRKLVKDILQGGRLIMVHVKASSETCKNRDPKGLYKKLEEDKSFGDFPGVNSPFDPPNKTDLIIDTETMTINECVEKIAFEICRKTC